MAAAVGAATAIPTIRCTDTLRMACAVAIRPASMSIMVGRGITPAATTIVSFTVRPAAVAMRLVVAATEAGGTVAVATAAAAIVEATHQQLR